MATISKYPRSNRGEMFNKFWKRTPSTSLCADESFIYGRQRDKEAFLELILSSEAFGNCGGSVFAIVGMAGVGKTTLAQLVYNDHRVMNSFDFKRWVFVSDNFDVVEVTKSILQDPEFTTRTYNGNDLDLLQSMLRGKLSKKKFFIVLDDVWNENYKKWEILCKPFAAGAPGSIIIVTTRNKGVSTVMDAISPYHLNFLSNDDCLSVFAKHALARTSFSEHPNLLAIGRKIANKCEGLPLAAITYGGLLRTNLNHHEWTKISESKIWDLPENKSNILPTLLLSYDHLPPHLKKCFDCCSSFPKDYEFDRNELYQLWEDKGLLPSTTRKRIECFEELLSRSFFERSSHEESRFVMHGLINDLAKFTASSSNNNNFRRDLF
ncbi:hypothetical protein P3X46_013313 [Hevea brasiliensis]|uniref:NB-ARC domain-containing protein n=1 Tax=Hevea brasiliensis TaxID=3981 RepID=A0ABQ9M339_HEVBR|nr:putative disease resistance RPP13-like protein 1 [Hevea brasiliensis]KAJ9174697.1 hypothetical protein P3X46_013313 [Hevea brasiliensis]